MHILTVRSMYTECAGVMHLQSYDLAIRTLSIILLSTRIAHHRMTSIALVSILGSVCYIFGLIAISSVGITPISYIFVDSGGYAVLTIFVFIPFAVISQSLCVSNIQNLGCNDGHHLCFPIAQCP